MHTWQVLAFLLFAAAVIVAVVGRRNLEFVAAALALTAAGLAVALVPVVFEVH